MIVITVIQIKALIKGLILTCRKKRRAKLYGATTPRDTYDVSYN